MSQIHLFPIDRNDENPTSVMLELSKRELDAIVAAFEAVNHIGKVCHFRPLASFVVVARGLGCLDSAIRRAEQAVQL